MVTADGNRALSAWLHEVLKHQCHDGTVVLPDGTEALVELDGDCVLACTTRRTSLPTSRGSGSCRKPTRCEGTKGRR